MNAEATPKPPAKHDAATDLPIWRKRRIYRDAEPVLTPADTVECSTGLSQYRLVMTCGHSHVEHKNIIDATPCSEPSHNHLTVPKEVTT